MYSGALRGVSAFWKRGLNIYTISILYLHTVYTISTLVHSGACPQLQWGLNRSQYFIHSFYGDTSYTRRTKIEISV